MKRMKKLFAILMTMAMVMGLGITGFAAESTNVTITVDNAEGATVKYVQIVKADTSSTDGWAYVDTYASYFTGVTIKDLVSIGEGEKDNLNYYSQNDKINNSNAYENSSLAEALEKIKNDILKGTLSSVETVSNNSFTVGAGGLYVLIPEKENYTYSPTLVYVPVNSTDAIEVDVKGAPNKPEKDIVNVTPGKIENNGDTIIDNDMSVTKNDTVEYKVTIEYPFFSDGANKTFNITDSVENGTYKGDVSVSTDGARYTLYNNTAEPAVEVTTIDGLKSFKMVFDYDPTLAGQEVEITYSVTVDSNVSEDYPLKNTVGSTIGTEVNQKVVITDTVGVTFNKIDPSKEDADKKISGAVFALYEGTPGSSGTLISIIADVAEDTVVTLPESYKEYENLLVKDGTADGIFHINYLDANKSYYIKEIVAPDGYKVVNTEYALTPGGVADDYPKLNIDKTAEYGGVKTLVDEYKYNDFTVNIKDMEQGNVPNTTLSALPSTGGMGTTIFTIAGCVIMISAAGLFFASRRKAN